MNSAEWSFASFICEPFLGFTVSSQQIIEKIVIPSHNEIMVPGFVIVKRQDPAQVIRSARIPAIPEALRNILDAVNRPSTTSAQLEKLVLQDPSICAQILKLVNSSYYSLAQRVTSLNQAIVLVGHTTVKSIAATLIMLETVGSMPGISKPYLMRVWQRAVACGGLVRLFARKESEAEQQKLFLAGLSHDIGHLVLSVHYKREYDRLISKDDFPTPDSELKAVGTEHAEIGAALLKQWGFSDDLVELVKAQHSKPDGSPAIVKEVKILEAGDILADLPRLGRSFDEVAKDEHFAKLVQILPDVGWTWEDLKKEESRIFSMEQSSPDKSADEEEESKKRSRE